MKRYYIIFLFAQIYYCFPNAISKIDNIIKCGKNLFSFLNMIDAIQKEITLAYDLNYIIDMSRYLIVNGLNSLDECNNTYFNEISLELETLNDFIKIIDPFDTRREEENLKSLREITNKISIICKDIIKKTTGLLLTESVELNKSKKIKSNKIEEVLDCIDNIILFSTYFDYLQTSGDKDFIEIVKKTNINASLTKIKCDHIIKNDNEIESFKQCFKHIEKVGDLSNHLQNFTSKEFSLILPYLMEYCDEGENLVKQCKKLVNELEIHFIDILMETEVK